MCLFVLSLINHNTVSSPLFLHSLLHSPCILLSPTAIILFIISIYYSFLIHYSSLHSLSLRFNATSNIFFSLTLLPSFVSLLSRLTFTSINCSYLSLLSPLSPPRFIPSFLYSIYLSFPSLPFSSHSTHSNLLSEHQQTYIYCLPRTLAHTHSYLLIIALMYNDSPAVSVSIEDAVTMLLGC